MLSFLYFFRGCSFFQLLFHIFSGAKNLNDDYDSLLLSVLLILSYGAFLLRLLQVSRLSRHQVENIIAPRFGDTLRTVISGCLLRDPSARLSASACLDLLNPKEAARLRGESVRGWLKRNPKPPKRILSVPSTGNDDDDEEESDMDTSSGSEPENTGSRGKDKEWDNGEQNNDDDDEEEDDHFDGMRWRRKRYGVKEAVTRAERRVRLFQRAEWWRQLDEPSRRDRLRRRRCRVEARAR